MTYTVVPSKKFMRQYRKLTKSNPVVLADLKIIIDLLSENKSLPIKNRNHRLTGNLNGYWECHIDFNWLLIYRYDHDILTLELFGTGTHNDLF